MFLAEMVAMWSTVFLYAAASVGFVAGTVFGRLRMVNLGLWSLVAGCATHAAGIGIRWVRVGHGPYLGFYEVASLMAYLTVLLFLWLSWRHPSYRVIGAATSPLALLILGAAMLATKESEAVAGALASVWLVVHVIFANLAYGCYVAAFVLALAFLIRGRNGLVRRLPAFLERLPDQDEVDDLTYRFVGAGFLFQGIMIASGAIWANEAWGRYWAWDPMETWSLIAWVVYAIYLHLRLTMGWSGRKAAWVAVIALPVIVFALLGVPLVYSSIHGAYLYT